MIQTARQPSGRGSSGISTRTMRESSSSPGMMLPYHGSIRVDQGRCLITTEDQLIRCQADENMPATIWLKTSFSLRDPDSGEPRAYTQQLTLDDSSNLTEPQVVRHDEIALQVRGGFSGSATDEFRAWSRLPRATFCKRWPRSMSRSNRSMCPTWESSRSRWTVRSAR